MNYWQGALTSHFVPSQNFLCVSGSGGRGRGRRNSSPRRPLATIAVLAFLPFLARPAFAQGCAQHASVTQQWICESNGHECRDQDCVDGGRDIDFCSQGYGVCCDQDINTATVTCDEIECCDSGGDCAKGCNNPPGPMGRRSFDLLLDERRSFWSTAHTLCTGRSPGVRSCS